MNCLRHSVLVFLRRYHSAEENIFLSIGFGNLKNTGLTVLPPQGTFVTMSVLSIIVE